MQAVRFVSPLTALTPSSLPLQHSSFMEGLWAAAAALAAALLGTGAAGGGTCGTWGGAAALLACFAAPIAVVLPSSITFMAHGALVSAAGMVVLALLSPGAGLVALPFRLPPRPHREAALRSYLPRTAPPWCTPNTPPHAPPTGHAAQ